MGEKEEKEKEKEKKDDTGGEDKTKSKVGTRWVRQSIDVKRVNGDDGMEDSTTKIQQQQLVPVERELWLFCLRRRLS